MTNRRSKFACSTISALPRSRCCLLFSLHARVYLTFPLTKTYGYGRLCDRCDYMETVFFAIVCDCLRSAICDLRSYGNQPLYTARGIYLDAYCVKSSIWSPAIEYFLYPPQLAAELHESFIHSANMNKTQSRHYRMTIRRECKSISKELFSARNC